jgi:hypothetical protein|tara:strand:+ start:310 stop:471 length:162 start_codon:yes stop_codon:yes gene_type:complete
MILEREKEKEKKEKKREKQNNKNLSTQKRPSFLPVVFEFFFFCGALLILFSVS